MQSKKNNMLKMRNIMLEKENSRLTTDNAQNVDEEIRQNYTSHRYDLRCYTQHQICIAT